jgi:LytS/YehU family sensor histidine kinase
VFLALWTGGSTGASPDVARSLLAAVAFFLIHDAESPAFRRDEAGRDIDETRVMRAELSAQRMRIAPHFLFNVLNAVSGLIALGRTREAERVIGRTADFFRRMDRAGRDERVRLRDEIDTLQAYFDVEQARFGPRMRVRLRLDPGVTGALVPPLVLQPLAENAVKHGVARAAGPVQVTVSAINDGSMVTVEVADDAPPVEQEGVDAAGSGLEIVRRTLAAAWGPRARLTVVQSVNGFRAAIVFPLEVEPGRRKAA